MTDALAEYQRAAAKAIRFKPFIYPSQWIAENVVIGEGVSEQHGPIDIWRYPTNVGVVDMAIESKRGILWRKPVQRGASQYMQGLLGWELEHGGGPVAYSMAKDPTMRIHALRRIEPIIDNSPGLRATILGGKANHETILSKEFVNATLEMFGAGSENNFISNPYRVAFADEFERMGIFPSGNDACQLLLGRQTAFASPKLYGWTTPLSKDRGITPMILHESDCRVFWIRCPHCRQPINLDIERDIHYARDESNQIIPEETTLRCFRCSHPITDNERAAALVHAAQSACPWYTAVANDPELGWRSTLTEEEAATREYAGILEDSHLLVPHIPLIAIVKGRAACRIEAQLKVWYHDVAGLPRVSQGEVLTIQTVESRAVSQGAKVPPNTKWITAGCDVQGVGTTQDAILYYDISAWTKDGRKVTLEVDRLKVEYHETPVAVGRYLTHYPTAVQFFREWSAKDGGTDWRLNMMCIDAGYKTRHVYAIANCLSPSGSQWAAPVIYSDSKIGAASFKTEPQNADVGDPARNIWLCSRDFTIDRAVGRLLAGTVDLPSPVNNELAQHYTSNVQEDDYDRHGNYRGTHWKKRERRGERIHDDWLHAAGYCEFAAVLLGLDQLAAVQVDLAHREAADFVRKKQSNRNARLRQRWEQSRQRRAMQRTERRK